MSGNAGISRASGSGKSTTKGQSVKVVKTKQRKTKEIDEKILTLRSAIFSSNGKDKDVSEGISPAFMNYTRNGLNLHIIFSTRLQRRELNWAFGLVKENMEERYDNSGYGWDDDDKERELSEDCTRFLLVQDRDQNNRMIGFVHFRFSVEG